jgi:threonine dehydrogenase-like Zn-dependent dehydrogenase
MRALVFRGAWDIGVESRPDPRRGPDDGFPEGALVTVNPVIACGSCPACRAGAEQSCPRRRVIGVNKEIESAFADLLVVPARNVVVLPESMPEEYGALVEPLAVGYHAAVRGRYTPDYTVLVIGGGPIGQACVLAVHGAFPRASARAIMGAQMTERRSPACAPACSPSSATARAAVHPSTPTSAISEQPATRDSTSPGRCSCPGSMTL